MNCKNCGKPLMTGETFCRHCGTDYCGADSKLPPMNYTPRPKDYYLSSGYEETLSIVWRVLSFLSFVASGVCLYLGIDKMIHYHSSDYASLNVNAYVGGDAYNYIINGTYTTAFFVLAAGLFLGGIGFIILYYLNALKAAKG